MFSKANWIALVMVFVFLNNTKFFFSFFQAIVSVKTLVECISAQCTFVRTSKMKGYLNVYFLYFLLIYCLTALKFRY